MTPSADTNTSCPSKWVIILSKPQLSTKLPKIASLRSMLRLILRLFPYLLNLLFGVWIKVKITSPGKKSKPCSDYPLKTTLYPSAIPFSISKAKSRCFISIFWPLQAGHTWWLAFFFPSHFLHLISMVLTSPLSLTFLLIFPDPSHISHTVWASSTSPVPLHTLHIYPLRKLKTDSLPE